MRPRKKVNPALAGLIIIVLIGIVATAIILLTNQMNSTESTTTPATSTPANNNGNATNERTNGDYENGTFSATGSYSTPGGLESIELSITLDDGVISSTSLVRNATDGEARQYQAEFASAYADMIIGKDVDEVSLSRVAGSSLTSNGFNQALEHIKNEAAI